MVKAFAHPLRLEILRELGSRASPTELARQLGAPLGSVSYHVRVLADLGALELVDQAPRRGAIEHYYALAPGLRLEVLNPALDGKAREELLRAADAFRRRVDQIERESEARGGVGTAEATVMLMTYADVNGDVTPEAG